VKRKAVIRDLVCEVVRMIEGPGDQWVIVIRGRIRKEQKRKRPTRKSIAK
jgi:hypothetical protein